MTVVEFSIEEVHAVMTGIIKGMGWTVVEYKDGGYIVEKDDETETNEESIEEEVVVVLSTCKSLVVQDNHEFEDFSDNPFQESMCFDDEVISVEEFDEELSRVKGNQHRDNAREYDSLWRALKYYGLEGVELFNRRWFMSHLEFREACFRLWAKHKTEEREQEEKVKQAWEDIQRHREAYRTEEKPDTRVHDYLKGQNRVKDNEIERLKEMLKKARATSKKKDDVIAKLKERIQKGK